MHMPNARTLTPDADAIDFDVHLHEAESSADDLVRRLHGETGSIPEWVMLLVMGIGVVMALWAVVQPDLVSLVTDALGKLRG